MAALIFTVALALGISFLCSILEAALFSVRETELAERAAKGERGALRLQMFKAEKLDDAISAILILNTVAHTIGAAMAGAQAADVFGDAWVGVFSAVLTLLVLVVTEIIPKTIGAAYASGLVPFVAIMLVILTKGLAPLLYLTRAITRLIKHPDGGGISRGEVRTMVESAANEGLLRQDESRIIGNALRLGQVAVREVMTPRPVVETLEARTKLGEAREALQEAAFTRLPVHREDKENVVGYALVPELLRALSRGEDDQSIADFVRPLLRLDQKTSVGDALRKLVHDGNHIAFVGDEFGGMAGVVTLEDLLETLIGAEITDESDTVEDLRELAAELRDRRLKERKSKTEEKRPEPEA